MTQILFPKQLNDLLEGSNLQAPVRALADRVGEILADNKLHFFPDYTDHGVEHVSRVLASEVELVPKQVWEESKNDSDPRLLCDVDAAIIIGATLLHDIAMHLRPKGFLELVRKDSRYQPLPWFCDKNENHEADLPWHELWEAYIREARRFSDRDLANIIGEESARSWKFSSLPEDSGQWNRNDCLIIGEFIRRHHARLAHEIAIYGFPGLQVGSGEESFPAMGREQGHPLKRIADLIGLTARSHGMSLRVAKTYLDSSGHYPKTPKPMGSAAIFPMTLLRVADYLQIDRQRAPAVLLQLRDPQSPISVQEWQAHQAVQHIGPADDPRGKMLTVSPDLTLSQYLHLEKLFDNLQTEIDHSTAVLDEAYGTRIDLGLDKLNLSIRRIHSNLHDPAFRDKLSYVPEKTGFAADPNLLTLLVEPLYGNEPGVGVRELIQNAVDAVRELDQWCKTRDKSIGNIDLPNLDDADILIELVQQEDSSWVFRIQDRGIGMTSNTIQNYFLRAGASFRNSSEWSKEFSDDEGHPQIIRAGRFGIGAFSIFLLGRSFKMWTRHVIPEDSEGYSIEVSLNSHTVEITKDNKLPVGTIIEVEIGEKEFDLLRTENDQYHFDFNNLLSEEKNTTSTKYNFESIDWYCWDWPKICTRIKNKEEEISVPQKYTIPISKVNGHPEWTAVHPEGYDAVYWSFCKAPKLSCNGLAIKRPDNSYSQMAAINWPDEIPLAPPNIAVLDSNANLPLTIQRYGLAQETVSFSEAVFQDVLLSFIAHSLICGPESQIEALSLSHAVHPLSPNFNKSVFRSSMTLSNTIQRWFTTSREIVPADSFLFSFLGKNEYLVSRP